MLMDKVKHTGNRWPSFKKIMKNYRRVRKLRSMQLLMNKMSISMLKKIPFRIKQEEKEQEHFLKKLSWHLKVVVDHQEEHKNKIKLMFLSKKTFILRILQFLNLTLKIWKESILKLRFRLAVSKHKHKTLKKTFLITIPLKLKMISQSCLR